jgi:hypothetical protein
LVENQCSFENGGLRKQLTEDQIKNAAIKVLVDGIT